MFLDIQNMLEIYKFRFTYVNLFAENALMPAIFVFRFTSKTWNCSTVNFVVFDMYSPYISLIKELFINAKIVFDRFHIVNSLSRSLNKARISIMNKFKVSSTEYKALKRYYKLLLKNSADVDYTHYYKMVGFKKFVSQADVIEYICTLDKTLKNTYELYQNLLYAIKNRNSKLFFKYIHTSD